MSDIRYVAVGQQRFDAEGNREGTIIGSYHWPERVAEAGLTGEWLELILIPASRQDRDWSMLEAAQESIREKDAEIDRLRTELAERDEQEPVDLEYALMRYARHLVDNVATSTQDRRFLRGDESEDTVLTESLYLNAKAVIAHAIRENKRPPAPAVVPEAPDDESLLHAARTTLDSRAYRALTIEKRKDGIEIEVPSIGLKRLAARLRGEGSE